MSRLARDKIKGLLHIAGISMTVVVITATLLRIGLEPKTEAHGKHEATSVTLEVVSPVR